MIIEKLQLEDVEQAAELQKLIVPFPIDIEKSREYYKKMLENKDYYLLVAKEEDRILGTVTGICCNALAAPFLVVEDLVVEPEQRGKGIGTLLMEELEKIARRNGCAYAILVSSGHRKGAHKLYERLGYVDDVRGFRKVYETED